MATISEDYVSFETAKLLKEKGFDQNCATYYLDRQVWRHYHGEVIPKYKQIYAAPTQSMAMKWLREVHNWNIFINKSNTIYGYNANIESLVANHIVEVGCEKTYEQACEVAIKYCLENLI